MVTLQDLTPLEELGGQRAGLLGRVSHELRTQLTSIRGSATSLLEAGSDRHPAEMRPFLRILLEQAEHLHGLIGDLLDKANIQTDPLPIHPEAAEIDVTIPAVEGAATGLLAGYRGRTAKFSVPTRALRVTNLWH